LNFAANLVPAGNICTHKTKKTGQAICPSAFLIAALSLFPKACGALIQKSLIWYHRGKLRLRFGLDRAARKAEPALIGRRAFFVVNLS